VLVRREGSSNSQESVSSVTPGINLKHTYVYLTITGSARSEASTDGPGTIGSGRLTNGQMSEEASKAKEYKLDTLVKMLDDYPLWQAVIHVGTNMMLEAVVMRLASRNWETLYLVSPSTPYIAALQESKLTDRHQQCPNPNEKRSYNNGVHLQPTPDPDS
jgi:translation initiation factor 4A